MSDISTWTPDEVPIVPISTRTPKDSDRVAICRCGHPVMEHYVGVGCQSARSRRPSAYGEGMGSSRCECPTGKPILTILRHDLRKFRKSPLKGHALAQGVAAVYAVDGSTGADRIWPDIFVWDTEQLFCEASVYAPESCTQEQYSLVPLYMDRAGVSTVFLCPSHAERRISQGLAFEHLPLRLTKAQRKARLDRHVEALSDRAYREAEGLERMRQPLSVWEAQRRIRARAGVPKDEETGVTE